MKENAMNTLRTIVSIGALLIAAASWGGWAASTAETPADLAAKKEICFKNHGKLMPKPALMNVNDCWRVHGYLSDR
jgi:hypothetical protein